MQVEELRGYLDQIVKIPNREWLGSLNERKLKELEFHNRDRNRVLLESIDHDMFDKYYSNKKFYGTIRKSKEYTDVWIASHAKGKIFLDYACGNGGNAMTAARAGARLSLGFDISDISVDNARLDSKAAGLSNTFFFQADAENTHLPDHCIDTIICSGMLHHLDLSQALPELQRILAPGGRILAVEALDYNPLIKFYRKITPHMRTDWEKSHILSLKDVKFASNYFDVGDIKYWHITSYAAAYMPLMLPVFESIDELFTKIPFVRLMAWIFTFELLSKKHE